METSLARKPILIEDEELAKQFERALKCRMCNQVISGYDFQACKYLNKINPVFSSNIAKHIV